MKIRYTKELDRVQQKKGYSKESAVEKIKKIALSVPPSNLSLHKCGICTAVNSVFFVRTYKYLWRTCKACCSIFVANPPTAEDLERMYNSREFASMNKHIFNEDTAWFRVNKIAKPKYDFIRSCITTEKKTWLDIGCGPGELLYVVQNDGWEASGVDTDPISQVLGKEYFDVSIDNKYLSLEVAKELDTKYGVISMMNVLEHCLDPRVFLEMAATIQDVGDNLMLELPHFPSLSAILCAFFPETISRVLTPPLHLYIFSISGTFKALKDYGYTPVACWVYGQDIGELADVLDLLSGNTLSFHKLLLPMQPKLQEIVDRQLLGDHFLVFSEKVR